MSATPIRALIASRRCGSATPGNPMWTASPIPSSRRAVSHAPIAAGSKHSWVVMYDAYGAFAWRAAEQRLIRDERMALRVARDPDRAEPVADVGHLPEQRQPVGVVAVLLRVAADDERPIHAGSRQPAQERAQVGPIADHPRRQVGDRAEPCGLELLGELDGRFDRVRRRGRHRHVRACRQERRLGDGLLQGDELERRRRERPGEGVPLLSGQVGSPAEEHRIRRTRPASTPSCG